MTAHRRLRGIGVYRTIFSSTVATSVAVAAVIFSMLFNPIVGLLPWLGIDPRPPIIENPDLALGAVALVTVWQTLGLTFILLSAGLQAIPDELLEAAQVDGAGPVTRFWRVTIPMLSPTLFFAFVVGHDPRVPELRPDRHPHRRRSVRADERAHVLDLQRAQPGEGCRRPGSRRVLAIALFFITLGLTVVQMRVLERRVHYAR